MITVDQAQTIIARKSPRPMAHTVPLSQALGGVLAKNLISKLDFPPFDKSAMDGYAVAAGTDSRVGSELRIVGVARAGDVYPHPLGKGEAVRIMTGALVPRHTERVIMQEKVILLSSTTIRIIHAETKNNIAYKGESLKKGQLLYAKGQILSPVVTANIASAGIDAVSVYSPPSVGILVTGSELLSAGAPYQPGKIYNSNGPLLQGLLAQAGISNVSCRIVRDAPMVLQKQIHALLEKSDIVFITGGVSVGDYDFVSAALTHCGAKIHFNQVAVQPGKPFTFATLGKKLIFAFPGNPVSVYTSYVLFARPILAHLKGLPKEKPSRPAKLDTPYQRRSADREQYVPVRFTSPHSVGVIPYHGSGDLFALGKADGLLKVPVGQKEIKAGATVRALTLS